MESDAGANRSCTVGVTDPLGSILATSEVSFYTNATAYEPSPSQSDLGGKVTGPGDPPAFASCASSCSLYAFKCQVLHACWGRLAGVRGQPAKAAEHDVLGQGAVGIMSPRPNQF